MGMKMMALALVLGSSLLGRGALAQCTKDTDCKGDRICVKGVCTSEEAADSGTKAASPASTPPAAASAETTAPAPVDAAATEAAVPAVAVVPPTAPVIGQHLIHVVTTPPGAKVSLDGAGGWTLAPHTFTATPGQHVVSLKAGGYDSADVPVAVADTDLTVSVEMNRPVFATGVAFMVIGTCFAIAGAILVPTVDAEGTDPPPGVMNLGFAALFIITGSIMMAADGVDGTKTTVTATSR